MRHRSVYGPRARIGLIVPPTNTVNEAEWGAMMPPGVTFHTTRMPLHLDTSSDAGRRALERDLRDAVGLLAQAGVDAIAYGCTAGSMVVPSASLCERIGALAGAPAVTTAHALVTGLRALGVQRVAVATPYGDTLNAHERQFLQACGVEVLGVSGLGHGERDLAEFRLIAQTPLEAVRRHVAQAAVAGMQAMLVSCTDFPTLPLLADLERELGVPVLSANQATLWAALRCAGIDDRLRGYGALFAH